MSALKSDRDTHSRVGVLYCIPAVASKKFYAGALLCVNANGLGTPGSTATGLRGIGRVTRQAVSTETAGEVLVDYDRGIFAFNNSTGDDAITRAHIGQTCFVVDDCTVAKTDGEATRSPAGIVDDVDAKGVWVRF
ncbi:hypothetical protein ACT6QH_04095 [Xanthobacter sp. TB0139]|uniref:hypothetical protein n=1 Tax=Xanthobacter sp. TB0139 TaxID=3459178 RepID=UPI0040397E8B